MGACGGARCSSFIWGRAAAAAATPFVPRRRYGGSSSDAVGLLQQRRRALTTTATTTFSGGIGGGGWKRRLSTTKTTQAPDQDEDSAFQQHILRFLEHAARNDRPRSTPAATLTVGPSTIPGAGRGLFLTGGRAVGKGEILTLYPGLFGVGIFLLSELAT